MTKITKIDKIIGILFILISIFFIISEYYTLSHSHLPIVDAYIKYTISKLAVPVGNVYFNTISTISPKANVLNNGLIILGITILIGNFVTIRKEIPKYKILFYILTLIFLIGALIVVIFHLGIPHSPIHKMGAKMIFFGGSFLLLFIGLSIKDKSLYKYSTLILGIIGLISGILICFILKDLNLINYKGLIERLNIYSMLVWMIITGIRLLLSSSNELINENEKTLQK